MALVDDVVAQVGPAAAPGAQVLDWDALRALSAEGVDVAPHTRTHPKLDRLADPELTDEVAGSLADLRREIGSAVTPAFAYPAGGVSRAAVRAVADAGYRVAFTTQRGANDLRTADPLRLSRINVGRRTKVLALRAQLALPAPQGAARPACRGALRHTGPAARRRLRDVALPEAQRDVHPRRDARRWSAAACASSSIPLLRENGEARAPGRPSRRGARPLSCRSSRPADPAQPTSAGCGATRAAYLGALRDVVRGTWRQPELPRSAGSACSRRSPMRPRR